MGQIKVIDTGIKDLHVIEPVVFEDQRGYFLELYNAKDFLDAGLKTNFVQDNQSMSKKGVLRGLHFQRNFPQGKLVTVVKGRVFDVAVDLRKNSDTYSKWYGVILSEDNKKQFYIPEGFAHGFLVLSDEAIFTYKCTEYYRPEDEGGIIWNDSEIAIHWPLDGIDQILLSEKDKKLMTLREQI